MRIAIRLKKRDAQMPAHHRGRDKKTSWQKTGSIQAQEHALENGRPFAQGG
jgi:hypothetical protein